MIEIEFPLKAFYFSFQVRNKWISINDSNVRKESRVQFNRLPLGNCVGYWFNKIVLVTSNELNIVSFSIMLSAGQSALA